MNIFLFFPFCFFLIFSVPTYSTAGPISCEELQARLEALSTSIEEAADATAAAVLQTELDSLSLQYASRCMMNMMGRMGALPDLGSMLSPEKMQPAATAEQEIKRRREALNLMRRQFGTDLSPLRAGVGEREVPISAATPIEGLIVVEGGASSTFYGALQHGVTYTIRETFVGNLIIVRYYDRIAGRYTGREDYLIQTLSTNINVPGFQGRDCVRRSSSRTSCLQWHPFDQWRIGDGEQYQGMYDGVVSADSDDRTVTVKVDAPDILFSSSRGQIGERSGCANSFKETVSHDQFKAWIRSGEIRMVREVGSTDRVTPGCRPGSTLKLEMRIYPEQ